MDFRDKLLVLATYVLVMFWSGLVGDTFVVNEERDWHPVVFVGAWAGLGVVVFWTFRQHWREPEA